MRPSFFESITAGFNRLSGGGVDDRNVRGETALYRAARAGNTKQVRALLRHGADPNIATNLGMTPLHEAAYWGEDAIVALLLKAGAKVNAANKRGWTPLHTAAAGGGIAARGDIIKTLLAQGARDDLRDAQGWTPRDYMALWADDPETARRLQMFSQRGPASKKSPVPPRP